MIQMYDRAPSPKPETFIFNLPRSTVDSREFDPPEFFSTVENLLDGEMTTVKYKGASKFIKKPHTFILTNTDLKARYDLYFHQ